MDPNIASLIQTIVIAALGIGLASVKVLAAVDKRRKNGIHQTVTLPGSASREECRFTSDDSTRLKDLHRDYTITRRPDGRPIGWFPVELEDLVKHVAESNAKLTVLISKQLEMQEKQQRLLDAIRSQLDNA